MCGFSDKEGSPFSTRLSYMRAESLIAYPSADRDALHSNKFEFFFLMFCSQKISRKYVDHCVAVVSETQDEEGCEETQSASHPVASREMLHSSLSILKHCNISELVALVHGILFYHCMLRYLLCQTTTMLISHWGLYR